MKQQIVAKLNPGTVAPQSNPGLFWALIGRLLEQNWVEPKLETECITSDGFILGKDGSFAGGPIAHVGDLERNIRGVAPLVDLTEDETAWLLGRIPAAFGTDWRRP